MFLHFRQQNRRHFRLELIRIEPMHHLPEDELVHLQVALLPAEAVQRYAAHFPQRDPIQLVTDQAQIGETLHFDVLVTHIFPGWETVPINFTRNRSERTRTESQLKTSEAICHDLNKIMRASVIHFLIEALRKR